MLLDSLTRYARSSIESVEISTCLAKTHTQCTASHGSMSPTQCCQILTQMEQLTCLELVCIEALANSKTTSANTNYAVTQDNAQTHVLSRMYPIQSHSAKSKQTFVRGPNMLMEWYRVWILRHVTGYVRWIRYKDFQGYYARKQNLVCQSVHVAFRFAGRSNIRHIYIYTRYIAMHSNGTT